MEIKERPILFNGEMVRAILDGRKTQTRRIVKNVDPDNFPYCGTFDEVNGLPVITFADDSGDSVTSRIFASCKFGKPGDRLWVRETFCYHDDLSRYLYKADGVTGVKWKPAQHMPRSASRNMLEITDIRIERLNDISEKDAASEGVEGEKEAAEIGFVWYEKPKRAFRRLWNQTNGKESWGFNPWVWVIEFKMVENGQAK